MADEKQHLYLIDGYGFVFRAYHSLPPLTNPQGVPVGAVYGFTNMLMKLKHQVRGRGGTSMLVVFDSGRKSFRNEIYPDYKAHRPPAPEDLVPQFPLVKDAAEALSLPTISIEGVEADDIIATYAVKAKEQGVDVTIVSSDKDLMQLVGDGIHMYDAMKSKNIGEKEVEEKFGVPPKMVLDMLALMGDSADNIPGVPGIGPKTASQLLLEYGSLEELLSRAEEIKQNKRRETLIENKEKAIISKELATLKLDVKVEDNLNNFLLQPEQPEILLPFLQTQGFKSLASKLIAQHSHDEDVMKSITRGNDSHAKIPSKTREIKTEVANSLSSVVEWFNRYIELSHHLTCYPLFSGKKELLAWVFGSHHPSTEDISQTLIVPLIHKSVSQDDLFSSPDKGDVIGVNIDDINQILKEYSKKHYILWVGYDLKRVMHEIEQSISGDDVQLLSYLLDGTTQKRELPVAAEFYLNESDLVLPEKDLTKFDGWSTELLEEIAPKAGKVVLTIREIHRQLKPRLVADKMTSLYERMERRLQSVLFDMEQEGIMLDQHNLAKQSEEFTDRIQYLEKEIHTLAGEEFNVGSPKQLGEVLFDKMGIEGGKRNKKSGQYTTDSDALEALAAQGHVIAENVVEWRVWSKLKNTYTDALPKQIDAITGRVHTHFGMTVTSTGRLSSSDPNLQNIPVRSEAGRKIRSAFVAKDGHKLISADYSQIELRLLAHVANIEPLKEAFKNNQDIHRLTASQVFGTKLEDVSDMQRYRAKAINFGIIYGQSAHGLALSLGISRKEAADYINAYFEQYPGIRHYMDEKKQFAHEHGYVTTLLGRKCFVPGINAKGPQKAFAERAAINAPLQGSAADIVKIAMIRVFEALEKALPKAKMLLQVHDEIIVEAPASDAEKAAKMITHEMENAMELSVPLTVEAPIGNHWGEIH